MRSACTVSAASSVHCSRVLDRKSTRLNSSHSQISHAVFCLKKKKPSNQSSRASSTSLTARLVVDSCHVPAPGTPPALTSRQPLLVAASRHIAGFLAYRAEG